MNTHDDFRNVISLERENLTRLSDFWNTQVKCDTTLSKDVQGRIRAAVGKTRLLLAEKFKQFEGLIEQSANNTSEKEISINDLQGFWDLVLIQVNEVKEMFRELSFTGDKTNSDNRKSGKVAQKLLTAPGRPKSFPSDALFPLVFQPKSPDSDFHKDLSKSGNVLKKKSASDYTDQTERKIRQVHEKDKGRSEAGDLKNKLSLSKL